MPGAAQLKAHMLAESAWDCVQAAGREELSSHRGGHLQGLCASTSASHRAGREEGRPDCIFQGRSYSALNFILLTLMWVISTPHSAWIQMLDGFYVRAQVQERQCDCNLGIPASQAYVTAYTESLTSKHSLFHTHLSVLMLYQPVVISSLWVQELVYAYETPLKALVPLPGNR